MLLLRFWNYWRGYVIILVNGYFLEKFINICTHRQVFLWDVRRRKDCTMTLKVSIKGFKLLRPVAKKSGCTVKVLGKKGFPFLANRYRKRKTFLIGAAIFILLVNILTSFIWSIEITGCKEISSKLIQDKLAASGVKPGVLKYGIDTKEVINNMMLEIKQLAWISVSVRGTKVKVELVEAKPPPVMIPNNVPCNIIAAKDGVIKSITVRNGVKMAAVGDTVTKGQILVSGVIKGKDEKIAPMTIHAMGTVKARTWYEETSPVELKIVEKERTGRFKDNNIIILFTKEIKVLPGKIDFANYDRVETRKTLSFGSDIVLPFGFVTERYYEIRLVERKIGLDDAKKAAADSAMVKVKKDMPSTAQVVKTDLNFIKKDNGELVADVVVECLEEIGMETELGGK